MNGDINNSLPIQLNVKPNISKPTVESIKKDITAMRLKLDRRNIKLSKIADTLVSVNCYNNMYMTEVHLSPLLIIQIFKRYITYFEQYAEYDPFFTPPEFSNPWLLDNVEVWDCDKHSCVI